MKFVGLYAESRPAESRLEILEKIWNHPLTDTNDKISSFEKAIELIKQPAKKKSPRITCPHRELIEKHLAASSHSLQKLEEDGEILWQLRMAKEMLDSVNSWRESAKMSRLSKESFASKIIVQSVRIETKKQENGEIHSSIELYFTDKDYAFDGHFMYALLEKGDVKKITLMG